MTLEIKLAQVAETMADSLLEEAERQGVPLESLQGLSKDNFNSLLDDVFQDGGEARCERFTDLGWEYSLQFGALESTAQSNAQWKAIQAGVRVFNRKLEQSLKESK